MNWLTSSLRNKIAAMVFVVLGSLIVTGLLGFSAGYRGFDAFKQLSDTVITQTEDTLIVQAEFKEQVQEWKNVLIRGHDQKSLDERWGMFIKQEVMVREQATKLAREIGDPAAKELLVRFVSAHEQMGKKYGQGRDAFVAAGYSTKAGDAAVKGIDREPTELLAQAAALMRKQAMETTAQEIASANRQLTGSLIALIVISALALLICWRVVLSNVLRPIAEALHFTKAIAAGNLDLNLDLAVHSRDEMGQLLSAMKEMKENLAKIVHDVRESALSTASASQEISAGNANLSQRTEEQASSLEETASSMEEMTSTVKQNADNAARANQMVEATRAQAEKGGHVVEQAVSAMDGINTASRKIADIISTIDGIAFQTNLLALNAAVEAARAGEQGRGFAVVATEVRNLAQRSANAAKEIKTLIEDSVAKVGAGSKLVEESGITLYGIVTSIKKVSDVVADIAAASHEQSSGIEQVNQAIVQMDEMTQQNAALVEEAAAASRSLEEQAQVLAQLMDFFKLGDENKLGFANRPVAHVTHMAQTRSTLAHRPQLKAGTATARAKAAANTFERKPGGDSGEWEKF